MVCLSVTAREACESSERVLHRSCSLLLVKDVACGICVELDELVVGVLYPDAPGYY